MFPRLLAAASSVRLSAYTCGCVILGPQWSGYCPDAHSGLPLSPPKQWRIPPPPSGCPVLGPDGLPVLLAKDWRKGLTVLDPICARSCLQTAPAAIGLGC
ncbi:hypothetical protein DPEC_G00019070 [Dallia pectoralis]|uniref:Uncharacterized protein n=1 Tax=Dallia pectoralis TaxID=75939 RepID=A0ACC2HGB9_DALPE|nr:hypothetical protein DPEC_G00019070 [Dallia pectoralis]